jgi:hypothetical protein
MRSDREPFRDRLRVEPEPSLRTVTEADRAKLRGTVVHGRARDPEAARDLRRTDQPLGWRRLRPKQLDYPPGDRVDARRIKRRGR